MAKVSEIVNLVVFISIWLTVSGQNSCLNNPCLCCKNNKCETNTDNYCTDGCIDGFWGSMCYNECPSNCVACTQGSGTCTACVTGKYSGRWHDDTRYRYYDDCSQECRRRCVSCTSWNNCDECVDGKSGDNCYYDCIYSDCLSCHQNNQYTCTKCKSGKYSLSDNCRTICPWNNCLDNTCDVYTGKCPACMDGFHGTYCRCPVNCKMCDTYGNCQSCIEGYKGTNCRCPVNCETCDTNDNCQSCIEGYANINNKCECKKDKCLSSACEQCNDITWYRDVNSQSCCQCSSSCKGGQCVSDTACASGCEDGYYGKACNNFCSDRDTNCSQCNTDDNDNYYNCSKCIQGYYPESNICQVCNPNCKNCDQSSGKCLYGCKNGFWGDMCESSCPIKCLTCNQVTGDCEVCENGKYTTDCSLLCSSNCTVLEGEGLKCGINDGACLDGCISTKLYGLQCSDDCSSNCKYVDCDWQTGNCLACVVNKYGLKCDNECSNKCVTNAQNSQLTRCYGENGTCTVGCISGFHGFKCEDSCSQYCNSTTCGRLNGECLHGCMDGYTGGTCTQALVKSEPETKSGPGAAIGGAVGGVVVVVLIAILVVFMVRRRRASNAKYASTYSNDVIQDTSKDMSNSEHVYDNTTESVNMYATIHDENVNDVIKPVSNPNYMCNKLSVKPIPKADDLRNSIKPDSLRTSAKPVGLRTSVQPNDLRKSTKSMKSNHELETEIDDVDNDVDTKITVVEGNYGYYNVAGIRRGIPIIKLAEYVAKRDKDDFEQEFKEFGNGLLRPYVDSQKPENRARNRYQHIYPYDEHRVHLQGSSTDYINASHIDGYQHEKEYIACLGPTEKATEDFVIVWMMIWEQNVEKIVMVTNLFENAAMKCELYWPDVTTSLEYGDVTVTCHSEDAYADYTLRSFTVLKGSESRSLHHIHYTAWPDKGVPDNVTSIIEFRQRVNSIQTKLGGPVIVHCSAGVGRTGTYIALDSLTKEGQDTQSVDIYGCVQRMREQRVNMVQTTGQYKYLHCAVVHSLTFDCAVITAENFKQHFESMNDQALAAKFKKLQSTVDNTSEEEIKAIAVNKKHKDLNRAGSDIPGAYRRPSLHLNKQIDACDYINAVLVNSFKTKNRFIVAMTPLPGTVLDFLTLLYQENCSCIVSLEAPESLNDKNVGTYYPAVNQELKHDVFKVTCTKGVTSDTYVMRKLTVTYNKQPDASSKTINHFQFTKWKRGRNVPNDPAVFLQLISDVETKANVTNDNGPILIHCLDGASRSGLFCAVSILRQKMEIEHEVSVVNTVRYIKSRRPSAIPNKDQYAFCHQSIVAYLDTFDKDIYSNFSLQN